VVVFLCYFVPVEDRNCRIEVFIIQEFLVFVIVSEYCVDGAAVEREDVSEICAVQFQEGVHENVRSGLTLDELKDQSGRGKALGTLDEKKLSECHLLKFDGVNWIELCFCICLVLQCVLLLYVDSYFVV